MSFFERFLTKVKIFFDRSLKCNAVFGNWVTIVTKKFLNLQGDRENLR